MHIGGVGTELLQKYFERLICKHPMSISGHAGTRKPLSLALQELKLVEGPQSVEE